MEGLIFVQFYKSRVVAYTKGGLILWTLRYVIMFFSSDTDMRNAITFRFFLSDLKCYSFSTHIFFFKTKKIIKMLKNLTSHVYRKRPL